MDCHHITVSCSSDLVIVPKGSSSDANEVDLPKRGHTSLPLSEKVNNLDFIKKEKIIC
jgi:hypothetical protein